MSGTTDVVRAVVTGPDDDEGSNAASRTMD